MRSADRSCQNSLSRVLTNLGNGLLVLREFEREEAATVQAWVAGSDLGLRASGKARTAWIATSGADRPVSPLFRTVLFASTPPHARSTRNDAVSARDV